MEGKRWFAKTACLSAVLTAALLLTAGPAAAHCDSLGGPVVKDARAALENGDVTPVLKWVQHDDETAIRAAFQKTLVVRHKGPEARDLADMYFLETLVRIHRAGEGASYTGLQSPGTQINPAVAVAEKALAAGNPEALKNFLTFAVDEGLQERFRQAAAAKNFGTGDVAAGRAYVAAYAELMHYAEGIYTAARAAGRAQHHEAEAAHAGREAGR